MRRVNCSLSFKREST